MLTLSVAGWPIITARPLRLPRRRSKNLSRSAWVGFAGGSMSTVDAGDRPGRARRPRQRFDHQRVFHRRHEVHRRLVVEPAGMAEVPLLEVRVLQPPGRGLLHHPVLRAAQVRRTGQPRAVDVGEHAQRPHDLRVLERLAANLPDDVCVHLLGGWPRRWILLLGRSGGKSWRGGQRSENDGGKQRGAHAAEYSSPAPRQRMRAASCRPPSSAAPKFEQSFYNPWA